MAGGLMLVMVLTKIRFFCWFLCVGLEERGDNLQLTCSEL